MSRDHSGMERLNYQQNFLTAQNEYLDLIKELPVYDIFLEPGNDMDVGSDFGSDSDIDIAYDSSFDNQVEEDDLNADDMDVDF